MHLYVAGKMTGLPGFNFQAFVDTDEVLHNLGHTTFNPAVHEIEEGIVPWPEILGMEGNHQELADFGIPFDVSAALRRDMNAIADADGIVLLDGWEASSGAVLETAAAVWAKKRVFALSRILEDEWEMCELGPLQIHSTLANFYLDKLPEYMMHAIESERCDTNA